MAESTEAGRRGRRVAGDLARRFDSLDLRPVDGFQRRPGQPTRIIGVDLLTST